MDKLLNKISLYISLIAGIFLKFTGGWDILLASLIIFMFFDYITGILKAFFLKNLDSKLGFWGIVKKIVILIIVSTAYILSKLISPSFPIREVVITFFISNEGLSILENASVFVPIPKSIKNTLNQLNKNCNTDDENK